MSITEITTFHDSHGQPSGDHVEWSQHHAAYLLDNPREFLRVEGADVDVFAVPAAEDYGTSWVPLGRVPVGGILTGGSPHLDYRLAVRREPAATLRRSQPGDDPEAATAGVLASVAALTGLRRDQLPPKDFTELVRGSNRLRRRTAARTVDNTLWIRTGPQVGVHGPAGTVTEDDEWAHVGPDNWVTADGETAIEALTTADLVANGDLAEAYTDHITQVLRESQRVSEEDRNAKQKRILGSMTRDAATIPAILHANQRMTSRRPSEPEFLGSLGPHAAAMARVARASGTVPVPDSRLLPALREATSYDAVGLTGWLYARPMTLEAGWWRTDLGGFVTTYGPDRLPCSVVWTNHALWIHIAGESSARLLEQDDVPLVRTDAHVVEVPAPSSVTTLSSLFRMATADSARDIVRFGLVSIAVVGLSMLTPIISGQVMGQLLLRGDNALILQIGIVLLALLAIAAAGQWIQNVIALRVKGRFIHRLGVALWSRLLRLPLPFFEARSTGALGTLVLGLRHLDQVLTGALLVAGLSVTVLLANLIVILLTIPQLGLLMLGIVVLVCAITARCFVTDANHATRQYAAQQRAMSVTLSLVSTVSKVRVAGAEQRALSRWAAAQREAYAHSIASRRVQNSVYVMAAGIIPATLALLFGLVLLTDNDWSLTALLTCLVAAQLALGNLVMILSSVQMLSPIVPVLKEIAPILREPAESGEGKAQPGELSGDIQLRAVSFRYGNEGSLVLDRVNLHIRRGEYVAIVGTSGSGKSTILRMLLGFEQPLSGSILYDGQELEDLDAAAVRRQCGIVLQNNSTLPGSIRDNICAGREYTDADVWAAAEMAGIADEIREMPMRLNTHVPDGGAGLSGGQRQRLVIARALIARPRIVMFDEATSALDNPTQAHVTHSTRMLNATRIVVAHRLSTIRDADRIIVMDRGLVVESGTYDELVAAQGVFADLVNSQK
ncbi:MAG: ATP-binding cassette domain-containing protein [Propionibacteriaceae bacterium]|nr:ATP-binding cassette domain-containing protein [Propionibacteriaceae bacterium]